MVCGEIINGSAIIAENEAAAPAPAFAVPVNASKEGGEVGGVGVRALAASSAAAAAGASATSSNSDSKTRTKGHRKAIVYYMGYTGAILICKKVGDKNVGFCLLFLKNSHKVCNSMLKQRFCCRLKQAMSKRNKIFACFVQTLGLDA